MSEFQFRLETLLELRLEAEATAAGALAAAQSEADHAQRARDDLERAHRQTHDQLSHLQRHGTDAGRLQAVRLVLERLEENIEEAEEALQAAQTELSHKRAGYHRANRERRALEELRAKRHDAWSRETARRDQRAMDEIATTRHVNGGRRLTKGGEV
ncbi:MAG: flagellar export protein FliJ [Gemmatimonadetes bacterium]|nr:flagellar export protein FliJ [Gemmatimonadota bacterium]